MATTSNVPSLQFHEVEFDLVEHVDGQQWLRYPQIADALGYSQANRVVDVYNNNAAEFTDTMTALVKLPTAGGVQEVRIFSLRGAHLLGMFARTERAAEFRRWVLDVLEHSPQPPAYPAVPALVGQTFERVVAERDALRAMLAERVLKEEPEMRRVMYYYSIEGLTHRERATLMGWKTTDRYLEALRRLATLGLLDYTPDAALSANGKRNIQKMRDKLAAGPLPAMAGFPSGHPSRLRPKNGRTKAELDAARKLSRSTPEHMAKLHKALAESRAKKGGAQ